MALEHPYVLPIGTRLTVDYVVDGVLGVGGFGITYIAKDLTLDRTVAIKEFFPNEFATRHASHQVRPKSRSFEQDYDWSLDRFVQEAQTLANFNHSTIVRVYRTFQANGTGYMVLQFEEGLDFREWLGRLGRPPSQAELLTILAPLLDALELVHNHNILHRDVAPDNIIIRPDGSPVLIDFGSSCHGVAQGSRTLNAIVKPGFSPFEQYRNKPAEQGPWTDIYALGATLYLAVTGKPPVDAPHRIVEDNLVPARRIVSELYAAHFLDAIDHALRLSIADRPQTIGEWRSHMLSTSQRPVLPQGNASRKVADQANANASDMPSFLSKPAAAEGEVVHNKSIEKKQNAPAAHGPIKGLFQKTPNSGMLEAKKLRHDAGRRREKKPDGSSNRIRLIDRLKAVEISSDEADAGDHRARPIATRSANDRHELTANAVADQVEKLLQIKHEPAPGLLSEPPAIDRAGRSDKPKRFRRKKKVDVRSEPSTIDAAGRIDKRKRVKKKKLADEQSPPSTKRPRRKTRGRRLTIALRTLQFSLAVAMASTVVYFSEQDPSSQSGPQPQSQSKAYDTKPAFVLSGHGGGVRSVAFSGDGSWIVSGSSDATIKIWSVENGQLIRTHRYHLSAVSDVTVNGEYMISADQSGSGVLWNLKSGKQIRTFDYDGGAVAAAIFAGERRRVIMMGKSGNFKLWDGRRDTTSQESLRGHEDAIHAVAYSRRGPFLVTGAADKTINLWNGKTFQLIQTYRGHKGKVEAVAISLDGKWLATGSDDRTVKIWSTGSPRLLGTLEGHAEPVTSIAFSPNGRQLVSASSDNLIKLWDLRSGTLLHTFTGHRQAVRTVAFSPDGRKIVSGSDDRKIMIWNVRP